MPKKKPTILSDSALQKQGKANRDKISYLKPKIAAAKKARAARLKKDAILFEETKKRKIKRGEKFEGSKRGRKK